MFKFKHKIIIFLVAVGILLTERLYAGINPEGLPGNTMVTLEDIYVKLQADGTAATYNLNPNTLPTVTMYTLQQIHNASPDFKSEGIAETDYVCNSSTFYGHSSSPVTGTRTACSATSTGVPDTGQTECYNATVEIPCGNGDFPAQDGAYTLNPPDYTTDTYTILDNSTGMEWQKYGHGASNGYSIPTSVSNCATGGVYTANYCEYDWQYALQYCANLTLDSHSDWRLPSINELKSIVDFSRTAPAINTTYFLYNSTGSSSMTYRTSTTSLGALQNIYRVDFIDGQTYTLAKTGYEGVRCVRGGI